MSFRISTLFWLTLAVACFFAGKSWDDFYERSTNKPVTLSVGDTVLLTAPSKLQVLRLIVSDPALATATAVSPTTFKLTGKAPGTTILSIWDEKGVRTDRSLIVEATQTYSFFIGLSR